MTNPIPDTTNTELREKIADTLRLGHYGIAETNVTNKILDLINTEVHKVLERLGAQARNKMYPNGIEDEIEKEKNRYV